MAVYNGERYLREAVESILAQTYPDFEVIIIDDGSSDASAGMLEEFARRDDRVRLVRQENIGLTRTLNKAIELSGGELLARMDADDIAMPDRLRRQVEFMQQHPRVVLLGGAYELIDGRGRLLTRITPPLDDQPLQELALAGRTPICHPLAMMRRDAVLKTGGYDESLKVAQDLDLWLRLGEVGELACLPDVLLKYRQHEESVSEAKQALQVQNMRLACERAWKRRGISGTFDGDAGWRPGGDRHSRHQYALRYGWWAFNSGQRRTAMAYGLKAIATAPMRADGWKLIMCALFKDKDARRVASRLRA